MYSRRNHKQGFSILEVLVAITVLAIGLSAMAALVAQTLGGTERARFMALATTLASEKLEDLNHWPSNATQVYLGANTSVGSLSSDSSSGGTNYYDDVDLSNTTGQVSETLATSTGYINVIHKSTGEVTQPTTTAAPTGTGVVGFHRRWLIEANPVVNSITLTGSRRVTVLVTQSNQTGSAPVSFQMSMVRP